MPSASSNSPEPVPVVTAPVEEAKQAPANPTEAQKAKRVFAFTRNMPCPPVTLPGKPPLTIEFVQPLFPGTKRHKPFGVFETSDPAIAERVRAAMASMPDLGLGELRR